ncbi:MAG TPA: hypothetical protein VGJ00_09730 [Rhabdochlamydiaceae bacterium]|jgi:hypothetical protein
MIRILFTTLLSLNLFLLSATEFTISSYNCGGLSDHYDYLRAASMEQLVQERSSAEPEYMSLNEKIQKVALKILFSTDAKEKAWAQQEWEQKGYKELFEYLTAAPTDVGSVNAPWYEKAENMITSYKIRPVVIRDEKVNRMLDAHLGDLTKNKQASRPEQLQAARSLMAKRILVNHLNFDIICLQEADYLDSSLFPENYEVLFAQTKHSKNGIAWNKERFELVESLGNILGQAFAVQLHDKETSKTVLIASGHLTGCNPFRIETDPKTGISDSSKGDSELQAIIDLFYLHRADLMIIGMDSNVTSLHPRLNILKDANYRIDCENYLDPTCTSPYLILNTRIDWIALKSSLNNVSITNIPVLSVGLNSMQTNISDHKPIAAKIQ